MTAALPDPRKLPRGYLSGGCSYSVTPEGKVYHNPPDLHKRCKSENCVCFCHRPDFFWEGEDPPFQWAETEDRTTMVIVEDEDEEWEEF